MVSSWSLGLIASKNSRTDQTERMSGVGKFIKVKVRSQRKNGQTPASNCPGFLLFTSFYCILSNWRRNIHCGRWDLSGWQPAFSRNPGTTPFLSLFGLIRTVTVILRAKIFQNCNVNGIMRVKSSEDTAHPQLAVALGFPHRTKWPHSPLMPNRCLSAPSLSCSLLSNCLL